MLRRLAHQGAGHRRPDQRGAEHPIDAGRGRAGCASLAAMFRAHVCQHSAETTASSHTGVWSGLAHRRAGPNSGGSGRDLAAVPTESWSVGRSAGVGRGRTVRPHGQADAGRLRHPLDAACCAGGRGRIGSDLRARAQQEIIHLQSEPCSDRALIEVQPVCAFGSQAGPVDLPGPVQAAAQSTACHTPSHG